MGRPLVLCVSPGGEKDKCEGWGKVYQARARKVVRIQRKEDSSGGKGAGKAGKDRKEGIIALGKLKKQAGTALNTSPVYSLYVSLNKYEI